MNSTGFCRTWPMAWKASWSQLDPGKTTTPNFMGTSGSDAGRSILAQRTGTHPGDAEGAEIFLGRMRNSIATVASVGMTKTKSKSARFRKRPLQRREKPKSGPGEPGPYKGNCVVGGLAAFFAGFLFGRMRRG